MILIPPPQYPSVWVLTFRSGRPGFNPQSSTESYQNRYNMVPVFLYCITGKQGLFVKKSNTYRLLYSWLYTTDIFFWQVPTCSSNMVKTSGHESNYISVLYSQLYNYLYYISNSLKKMPLLNYIVFLLSYRVNN